MTIQSLALIIIMTVLDYDESIRFYTDRLGFVLREDTDLGNGKRWVVLRPRGATDGQAGGRIFLFLNTDNIESDDARLKSKGVHFVREPPREEYGMVAVFEDLHGNRFDVIQPNGSIELDSS